METEYRVGVIGADDAGAPHRRERIWIVAYSAGYRMEKPFMFDTGVLGGSSDATPKEAGVFPYSSGERLEQPEAEQAAERRITVAGSDSQHPIGQLANPDVFGRLHGQAEVGSAERGVHAQREPEPSGEDVAIAQGEGLEGRNNGRDNESTFARFGESSRSEQGWWSAEPSVRILAHGLAPLLGRPETVADGDFLRVATGVPKRVDRLKSLGNGQVPAAVVLAWHTLIDRINER